MFAIAFTIITTLIIEGIRSGGYDISRAKGSVI